MRVALVTESFLPQVNGVTNTVRHVTENLVSTGHQVLLVAPGPGADEHQGVPVVRVRSVRVPGYKSFPLGLPDTAVHRALADFGPDVVHLASPIALGAVGLRAARRLDVPTVAVYQTDVGGFARHYGVRDQLAGWGVTDLHLWRRGVSLDLFGPRRRSRPLRRSWGLSGEVVVGYVGRLAAEKQVRRLAELADHPGVRLVVVGDGPERAWLERRLPDAVFTGFLGGTDLARAFASLDVFVHCGEQETFCQTVQEAQASGVAVVAPARGGPLDLVEHGRTGLLYDPSTAGSLRGAVDRLVREPLQRRVMAAAARRSVEGRTWSAVTAELVREHYAGVLGDQVHAPRPRPHGRGTTRQEGSPAGFRVPTQGIADVLSHSG